MYLIKHRAGLMQANHKYQLSLYPNRDKIQLTNGTEVTIDPSSFDYIAKFAWHSIPRNFKAYKAGTDLICYAIRNTPHGQEYMHRVILELHNIPLGVHTDHLDRNVTNNTLINLKPSSASENFRNSKRNSLLTVNGITQCYTAWAEQLGVSYSTIDSRVKRGWNLEDVVSLQSFNRGRPVIDEQGTEYKSVAECARNIGVGSSHLWKAIIQNWRCKGKYWRFK